MASSAATLLLLLLLILHRLLPNSSEPTAFETSLINQACHATVDFDSCAARLLAECDRAGLPPGPTRFLHAATDGAINEALRAIETISSLTSLPTTRRERAAVDDCIELLDYSVDELAQSLTEIARLNSGRGANLRSWLSAALGNQDTCLEGFDGTDGRIRHYIRGSLGEVTQVVGNLLAVYRRLRSILPQPRGNRTAGVGSDLPPWILDEEMDMVRADPRALRVDAVVAEDGSGEFRTVGEAVARAPSHGWRRHVIFVKGGVYKENVEVKRRKTNVMLVGEGMGVTIVTGSRNFMQGWTTFRTATFAVSGHGFIARDMTFRNTAGPQSHQAVALRVDSDRSAFFRCSIEGYQDTLYAHSMRQFYRDCRIHGTVDFIFGNGQAVFQNCKIFTRKALPFQKATVTAQGRKDPNQNTGFSIQNSFVYTTGPTYLGRPWKAYSRTVFMQSYLGSGVQPAGWLEWAGDFGLNTLFYGEYMNYGPGSGLGSRVRWAGYHVIKDSAAAAFFSVRRFINGAAWLPATKVPFRADLMK